MRKNLIIKITILKVLSLVIASVIFIFFSELKIIEIYSPVSTMFNVIEYYPDYFAFFIVWLVNFILVIKVVMSNPDLDTIKQAYAIKYKKYSLTNKLLLAVLVLLFAVTGCISIYKAWYGDQKSMTAMDNALSIENFMNNDFGDTSDIDYNNDEYCKLSFYKAIEKERTVAKNDNENETLYYKFVYYNTDLNIVDEIYKQLINDELKVSIYNNGEYVESGNNSTPIKVNSGIEYTLIKSNDKTFVCVLKSDDSVLKIFINCKNSDFVVDENALQYCIGLLQS